jgi:hypothetical protein
MLSRPRRILLLGLFALVHLPVQAEEPLVDALRSAKAWLAVVDAGEYAKSWQEAAPVFQAALTEAQWVERVTAVRDPLGKVASRKVISAQFGTTFSQGNSGKPEFEYFVLQFQTAFAQKPEAVETVTPMKTAAGWRVSGYFIK